MANILLVRRPIVKCIDQIRRLVAHASNDHHIRSVEIAATLKISKRTVDRILQRLHENGETMKKKVDGYKPKL